MQPQQVGQVENITAGQINGFFGTDFNDLPKPEVGNTFTAGVVWTPDFTFGSSKNWIMSVDYYDIEVTDVIGNFTAQEILDGCYTSADQSACDKIVRVGGTLTLPGSGIEEYTTNLDWLKTSGLEFAFSVGFGLGGYGDLTVSGTVNQYFENESRSSKTVPVIDCLGYYGNQCGNPLPETRWIQRTTWNYGIWEASYLWRYFGSTEIEPVQKDGTYEAFRGIDAYNYIDLYGGVTLWENTRLGLGIQNVFDESPPVVGNEAADTSSNGGNTFPQSYDVLGRVYSLSIDVKF
jgi:outer membrane receptor protein involved in Fe transport